MHLENLSRFQVNPQISLIYIYFIERKGSVYPDSVVYRSTYHEVEWCSVPLFIIHDDHWISHSDVFNIFSINDGLNYFFYII